MREKKSAATFSARCKLEVYLYCKSEVAVAAFVAEKPYCLVALGIWILVNL